MTGLAEGLQRLWLARFGFVHASEMMMMWRRFYGLDSTQLGIEKANIVEAYHRAGDFRETPLMGMGYGASDTASHEES